MSDEPLENTRRTFLASSALGALAGLASTEGAGETGAAVEPTFRVGCSLVNVEDWGSADSARVVYRDGSYVDVGRSGRGRPERFGSPGRVIDTVVFDTPDGPVRAENDDPDCDAGERSVTFTDSRVTVRAGEFVDVDGVPGKLLSQVDLDFVDGTSEEKVHLDGPPSPNGISGVYRGTGEHAGKVIEAVRIFYDLNYVSHYIRNPAADKHLLGKESCQERCLEIVGATEGAVDYEFTVDGPVRAVTLSDRRGATPGGNDAVTDNGDGTWTVDGFTGNAGYGDTYTVTGDVTGFQRTGGDADFRILYNGTEHTETELVDRH